MDRPPSYRLPLPLGGTGGRYLALSERQVRLLVALLAHPGSIVSANGISAHQLADLRSRLEAHGLFLGRVLTRGYQGYVLLREDAGKHLFPFASRSSAPSPLPPAQRGIQSGVLTPLGTLVGHHLQVCSDLHLLVIDSEQAFVLAPLLFEFVSALLSAGPGQPVRRTGPTPLRRQILHLRRLLRRSGLDIVTVQHYGYLLVEIPLSEPKERSHSMTALNQCTFRGRVDREPDCTQTSLGRRVARFPLLVESRDEPSLRLNVIAWENLAETVLQEVSLGAQVLVQGHLRRRTFTDQQTGKKFSVFDLVATTVLVVSPPVSLPAQDASQGENEHASSGESSEGACRHA